MKECIDQKIEKALNDKDITNIMNHACKNFMKQLDSDDIYTLNQKRSVSLQLISIRVFISNA